MAYNTRRNPYYGPAANVANVGQRRPPQLSSNFIAGGQLQSNRGKGPQDRPSFRPPTQQQPPQQPTPPGVTPNLKQQSEQFLKQQADTPQAANEQVELLFKNELTSEVPPPPAPPVENAVTSNDEIENSAQNDNSERKKKLGKPFWVRKDGKINKKERLRRRNQRLRKILQPKNALMVLNELIGSTPYNLSETPNVYDGTSFKCSVSVDGMEHIGMGKSKPTAKTAAAEAALKHMVLSKLKTAPNLEAAIASGIDADGDIKMEVETDDLQNGISWSHIACYALHKLLNSWDEGCNIAEKLVKVASESTSDLSETAKVFEKKPAKKLPDTATTMNPIMLLNQMYPNVLYEEASKTGNPPNIVFTIKCIVGSDVFLGSGSTKKAARKMCAFAACRKVLGIQYAPEFLEEHGFSEENINILPPVVSMETLSISI